VVLAVGVESIRVIELSVLTCGVSGFFRGDSLAGGAGVTPTLHRV
jgi:hypothetical protein